MSSGKVVPLPGIETGPDLDAIWADVLAAFAAYGRPLRAFGPERRKALERVVRNYGPEAPVEAVHGFIALHFFSREGKARRKDGWNPWHYFRPETVFRMGGNGHDPKVDKYLDAYGQALEHGLEAPFR